jgi:hypothetical protein
MTGVMVRGRAEVADPAALASGAGSAAGIVAALDGPRDAAVLVRLRAERLVWWQGWTSGTVEVA